MDQQDIMRLLNQSCCGNLDREVQALDQLENLTPALIELLKSNDEVIRADAAYALGQVGNAERDRISPALLPLLHDQEMLVRDNAVLALHLQPYPPALEPLLHILHHDPDWVVRASAAEALGNYQDEHLVDILEQVLRNEEEEQTVRAYVALTLGLIADPPFRSHLDASIAQGIACPHLKGEVLAACYRLGGQERLLELLDLLSTSDEQDIPTFLNALEDLTERKHPPTLLDDTQHIHKALKDLARRMPHSQPHIARIREKLRILALNRGKLTEGQEKAGDYIQE